MNQMITVKNGSVVIESKDQVYLHVEPDGYSSAWFTGISPEELMAEIQKFIRNADDRN